MRPAGSREEGGRYLGLGFFWLGLVGGELGHSGSGVRDDGGLKVYEEWSLEAADERWRVRRVAVEGFWRVTRMRIDMRV